MKNTTIDIKDKQITGTREAFAQLISKRGIYKDFGVGRATISQWKKEGCSLGKMEEMLTKAGAKVVSEKVWILKNINNSIENNGFKLDYIAIDEAKDYFQASSGNSGKKGLEINLTLKK